MSQYSNSLNPSLFETDGLVPLSPYLYSDSTLPIFDGRETQASQQTATSFSEIIAPIIPDCLERVGPTRRKEYVRFTAMQKKQFVDWWLETSYGKQKDLRWDATRTSEAWNGFDQVAQTETGLPKVMCQRCGQILEHPNFNPKGAPNGTSGLKRHRQGGQCQKGKTQKTQQGIEESIKVMVCIVISSRSQY
jgi:hypothetical protein